MKDKKKKTIIMGMDVKSPFHTNEKPANKLIEAQHKTSMFAAEKRNPFLPPKMEDTSIRNTDVNDYCTCERCPHCGKKIRRIQPMWSVSF